MPNDFSHVFNATKYSERLFNRRKDINLGFDLLKNGFVTPDIARDSDIIVGKGAGDCDVLRVQGGVYTKECTFVGGTNLYREFGPELNNQWEGYSLDIESLMPAYSNDKIIYLGLFISCWGHLITDCLRRIWFLLSNTYKNDYRDYKLAYTIREWGNNKIPSNFWDILEILNIDCNNLVRIEKPTRYSEIIIPNESLWHKDGELYYTKEYWNTINIIREYAKENAHGSNNDKIFFKRDNNNRYVDSEDYVSDFFKRNGYRIINPGKINIKTQLSLLIRCKNFASVAGSTSHNCLFLHNEAELILIQRNDTIDEYQLMLMDLMKNQKTVFFDSSWSFFRIGLKRNRFIIGEELMDYFNTPDNMKRRYRRKNLTILYQYIKYCINMEDISDSELSPEYYRKILCEIAECREGVDRGRIVLLYKIVSIIDRISFRIGRIIPDKN